jgi:hypothetical protein
VTCFTIKGDTGGSLRSPAHVPLVPRLTGRRRRLRGRASTRGQTAREAEIRFVEWPRQSRQPQQLGRFQKRPENQAGNRHRKYGPQHVSLPALWAYTAPCSSGAPRDARFHWHPRCNELIRERKKTRLYRDAGHASLAWLGVNRPTRTAKKKVSLEQESSEMRSKLNTQRAPLHGWLGLLGGNREGGSAEDIGLNTDDEFACPDARLIC